jgi:hypothetical protein
MTAPATPNEVALQLSRLARDLDDAVRQLQVADLDATEKRAAADLAFSRSFMAASGSVDYRKHYATEETHDQRLAADVADAVVRHLRRRIDATKVRIEVGRSYGAAIRAELNLSQAGVD